LREEAVARPPLLVVRRAVCRFFLFCRSKPEGGNIQGPDTREDQRRSKRSSCSPWSRSCRALSSSTLRAASASPELPGRSRNSSSCWILPIHKTASRPSARPMANPSARPWAISFSATDRVFFSSSGLLERLRKPVVRMRGGDGGISGGNHRRKARELPPREQGRFRRPGPEAR